MNPPILRLKNLRARAALLGTDVFHIVRLDAREREMPPEADDGKQKITPLKSDDLMHTALRHSRSDRAAQRALEDYTSTEQAMAQAAIGRACR